MCFHWFGWRQSYWSVVCLAAWRRHFLRHGSGWLRRPLGSLLARTSLLMRVWPHATDRKELEWRVRAEFSSLVALHTFVAMLFLALLFAPAPAEGHPGGLAADGCHNDRKNGGRHCHRGPKAGRTTTPPRSGEVYYPNCAAARADGAAPVRRGQPGYGRHLDRDNDGIGCE